MATAFFLLIVTYLIASFGWFSYELMIQILFLTVSVYAINSLRRYS